CLVRWRNWGTDGASGGAFETTYLMLAVFGPDGLMVRNEYFAPDHEDEAVARFDELVTEPAAVHPVQRRARPNAAAAFGPPGAAVWAGGGDGGRGAGEAGGLSAVLAPGGESFEHTTGSTSDGGGVLRSFRYLLRAQEPTCRHEPLATLGDSLGLFRQSTSARGFAGGTFDVGAYEKEIVSLQEGDAQGRWRAEAFTIDHLGDAIARLYARYAELLADGPAHDRAAATARSVAASFGPPDFDRWATAVGPDVELVHHPGLVGQGSSRGRDAWLRVFRVILETADVMITIEDILGLTAEACLVRSKNSGIDRTTGGAFEQTYLTLNVFGPDGLLARNEYFAPGHEDEALARFDELTAEPSPTRFGPPSRPAKKSVRRVPPNAATANAARVKGAIAARDFDAIAACLAERCDVIDHPNGATYDREGALAAWRSVLSVQDGTYREEPLATLGDSLALCRQYASAA